MKIIRNQPKGYFRHYLSDSYNIWVSALHDFRSIIANEEQSFFEANNNFSVDSDRISWYNRRKNAYIKYRFEFQHSCFQKELLSMVSTQWTKCSAYNLQIGWSNEMITMTFHQTGLGLVF